MKRMYNIATYWMIAILLLSASCSDDFLYQDPKTALSTEQLFKSMDNIQPFLNGLYFSWRDSRVNRKGFFLMLGTDESQQGEYQVMTDADQAGFDRYDGFMSAENKAVTQLWNLRWPIVVQASEALYYLGSMEANANEDEINRIKSFIGQAKFYRGAVLFELVSYWGSLPIPEIHGGDIILSGRRPLMDVYQIIENDLLIASERLPERQMDDPRIATKWAAKALLAKLYMSASPESGFRDFAKAKVLLEEIVAQGGFALATSFAHLWDPFSSPGNEPIFTFYFNNVWPDTNEAQWHAGSRATSGNPTNFIGGYDLILPTEYARNDISMGGLWEEGDQRKLESIRYNFVNGNNIPAAFAGFGDDQLLPHIKKYEDIRTDGVMSFFNSGKNMYYLRYADVLLSLAECLNETGNTPAAVDIVNNQIRRRAWGGVLPVEKRWDSGMSQEQFRIMILDERMRELCFEGWRRFDLIRTGQLVPLVSTRNRWAKETGSIQSFHKLFPIPLTEILQNPNISHNDQNPGY